MTVCFLRGTNLVTISCVLEVIINMQNEIEGMRKDIEDIYKKIDQSMAWMKENFTQVIKYDFANPNVPVTGEFCKFASVLI